MRRDGALTALLLLTGWLALAFAPAHAADPLPVPQLQSRVTDLTSTLSREQAAQLEAELAAFEARKGSQLVLLLVPTTQPENIEQFSLRVVEAWKPGRKGSDDGVLLTIAKNDRRLRIEVGYGLEGAVNDATARRIIDEIMVPRLREDDYFGAAQAGLQRLMRVIDGEPLPPPVEDDSPGIPADVFGIYMTLVLGAVGGGLILRSYIGRLPAGLASATIGGGLTWLFTGALEPAVILFIILLLGVAFGSTGGRSRGGYGGYGGGYSGGGGGFGGGGASGGW